MKFDDEDNGLGMPKCGIVDRLLDEKDGGFEISKYKPPKPHEIEPLDKKECWKTNEFHRTGRQPDFKNGIHSGLDHVDSGGAKRGELTEHSVKSSAPGGPDTKYFSGPVHPVTKTQDFNDIITSDYKGELTRYSVDGVTPHFSGPVHPADTRPQLEVVEVNSSTGVAKTKYYR